MDDQRFDSLARQVAGLRTRRSLFKTAAAGLAAALARSRDATGAGAQTCREVAKKCSAAKPCCPGLNCVATICVPNPGVPACTTPGQACPAARPCCPGTTCAGGVCCAAPQACGDQCCTGGTLCQNGLCQSPTGGLGCPPGQIRCGAAGCRNRSNDPAHCGSCGRSCPGGVCVAGACQFPNGAACSNPGQCLSGVCASGVCCDQTCDGACRSCALPTNLGTCTALPDTTVCGAGNLCAGQSSCLTGVCVPGTPVSCTQPDPNSCQEAVCDPDTGTCLTVNKRNSSPCATGLFCRENETCINGVCGGGEAASCTSPPTCQTFPGQCFEPARPDLPGGCFYQPEQNGLPCGEGKRCLAGGCVDCIPSGTQVAAGSCADITAICCSNTCSFDPDDGSVTCG